MADKQNPWKKLNSKVVHKNPWFYVRQDRVIRPDGLEGDYNVVVTPGAVFVVALDEDQNVYLIGQYRYPTDQYSIEIPAGSHEGKDSLEAAKRELQEETGLIAKHWKELGTFQTANGLLSEKCKVYLATGLEQTEPSGQEEEGIDQVIKVPVKECFAMIKRGEITDGQSIIAFMMLANELDLLK
jgi:8-oxo-dGTP pyrophosphatase MutT (NUDIX family)